ncbi:lysozyme inhibitor LprI family protein [Lichenihabitans sp. Uapishka_5]|uniref:lysozyme inhibitor LprI family protein n=1 Tax=Lichenihabitans sp. Uapishka_5 TaxID=3037302 RepID=UPI0029E80325|nr:lysozyme inhibitor LprI family protein [Lichenihabitans sp. Uapishka_5]MDX7953313.1 lysozyme inhibitor LprI family protein [Lichenihabitans sp. Uapishka_5]
MLRLVFAVILLVLSGVAARALDCKTASDQTSLNQCSDKDFKVADAALNAVYGQVVGRLANAAASDAKGLLTTAQRDWLAFRDAECAFRASDSEGGSMHPMVALGCKTQLTQDRTAALKRYLSCKAEDGDCPTAAAD